MIDLHIHSTYSDGTLSPSELVAMAETEDISALALCDHNTVTGLPAFLSAAAGSNVTAVPGIEFSTDYRGRELHILALFVQAEAYPAINALLQQSLLEKEKSNLNLIEALRSAGIDLDYRKIKEGTPNGQVNRAVIAGEMVRLGYCDTVQDAFSRWLSRECGYFVPPERLDVFDVLRFIHSIGAVSVLAHPFLNLDETELRQFLMDAKICGLDAMEVYYPLFDRDKTLLAEEIAEEFGLLKSGGSDFHGDHKPDIRLGTGKNNLCIQESVLENLYCRALEIQK